MATVEMCECDNCGARVKNRNEHPGWLHFTGQTTRSRGEYGKKLGCWRTAFLRGPSDFCSLTCMVAKLDSLERVIRQPRTNAARNK